MVAHLLALTLLITSSQTALPQSQDSSEKWVQISGKKNPEMIPEHVLWTHIFRFFSTGASMPTDLKHTLETKELPMTAVDYKLLRDYADRHMGMEQTFKEPFAKRQKAFTDTSDKKQRAKLKEELRALELERRYKTLELADTLLLQLTSEGRLLLLTWTQDFKSDITATIPEADLAFFRQPR